MKFLNCYHNHTNRCHHAKGCDEEYILKAISEGVKVLGFSDHAPYIYSDGYVSYYKMTPSEAGEYFSSLGALREKYRDKIKIYIGYEAEYYRSLWNNTVKFWKSENQPEYLILGQHFVREEVSHNPDDTWHSFKETDNPNHLKAYADSIVEGVRTGLFSCVAHPDLLSFTGDEDIYREEVSRIVKECVRLDLPLELNLQGIALKRSYPTPKFWNIAKDFSPKVILGADAHTPERVFVKDEVLSALRFSDKFHLNLIDELKLVTPFPKKEEACENPNLNTF